MPGQRKEQTASHSPVDSLAKTVLDNLGDAVSIVVGTMRVYVNDAYLHLYGLSHHSEAIGKRIDSQVSDDQKEAVISRALALQRGEAPQGQLFEYRITDRNGNERIVQVRGMPVEYRGERASLSIQRDVTDRVRTEQSLKEALSLNAGILDSTADGILVIDLKGRVVNFNTQFVEMWGLSPRSLHSKAPPRLKFQPVVEQLRDATVFVHRIQDVRADPQVATLDILELKDGRVFERYSLPHKLGESVIGRVWSFRDVTAQHRLEQELRHQANHDPLTDLLNRRGLAQFVEQRLASATEVCPPGAFLLLDLDQFKDVNDTLGHLAGDEILCEVVELLSKCLPERAVMARLGGDEFALMLKDVSAARATEVAASLLQSLQQHVFQVDGVHKLGLTASVGIALPPEHGRTFEELLARADVALYRSKGDGRNRVSVYEPADQHASRPAARLEMRYNIHEALEKDRLLLYGQPIVRLRDEKVSRYELLLRMLLPDGSVADAASFIPLAEHSGLIRSIDSRVVAKSVDVAARLAKAGSDFKLEVNLSGSALANDELLAEIKRGIRDYRIDPAHLIFEVTETEAVSNLAAAQRFIRELKDVGCGFALDDFGVGFSSLAELKNLPVDYLKIDGSFISRIDSSTVDQKLVRAMVGVAEALGMGTIAEFVGSAAAVECLKELGVGYAQGYYFGKARDLEEVIGAAADEPAA